MRALRRVYGVWAMAPHGRGALFEDLNRNKKSVTVNLKHPKGKEIMRRLVERSDVFVTNMRPDAVARLGIDYETLYGYNSRLIYASSSAYGEEGPDANLGSLELAGFARSGALLNCGEAGMPPTMAPHGTGDRAGGLFLAYGIMAALLARERIGIGQKVTSSQLGSSIAMQAASVVVSLLTGEDFPRHSRVRPGNPLYNYYRCKDGRWIALACPRPWYWPGFCRATGMPELETDPRFQDEEKRTENSQELVSIIDNIMASKTCDEWAKVFSKADLIYAPVNRIADLATDPQVVANEYITEWDNPVLGRVKIVGFPVKWHRTPARLRFQAPELGQHTEEVMVEICGYTWDEITDLREQGAI